MLGVRDDLLAEVWGWAGESDLDVAGYGFLRLHVIDMPQAVDARTNPNARLLLARDVANVCRYFASQGADAEPGTFASELWDLYGRAEL